MSLILSYHWSRLMKKSQNNSPHHLPLILHLKTPTQISYFLDFHISMCHFQTIDVFALDLTKRRFQILFSQYFLLHELPGSSFSQYCNLRPFCKKFNNFWILYSRVSFIYKYIQSLNDMLYCCSVASPNT